MDNSRRQFLKLGALFVPAAIFVPRVAYSFLWARSERYVWAPMADDRLRTGFGDLWIDEAGNVQYVQAKDVRTLITESILRSLAAQPKRIPWTDEPYFDLSRVVISGMISI